MELKIGDCEKVRLSLFKKQHMFEAGDRGLVLERADGGVCIYATDAAHGKILAAMPLGTVRDMKNMDYYIFAPDGQKLLAAVGRALFVMDFSEKWAASNLPNYRIYGSEHWGQECQRPWEGRYMTLFGLPDEDAPMDETAARKFWAWFQENEKKITEKLSGSGAMEVVGWVDEKICPVFPYMPRDMVHFELGFHKGAGEFFFFHNDEEKLRRDAEAFAAMLPEELRERWSVILKP